MGRFEARLRPRTLCFSSRLDLSDVTQDKRILRTLLLVITNHVDQLHRSNLIGTGLENFHQLDSYGYRVGEHVAVCSMNPLGCPGPIRDELLRASPGTTSTNRACQGFYTGFVSLVQMLVSCGQRYGVEFAGLAGCTLMLVRHRNKALEQDFHANRSIGLGNVRQILRTQNRSSSQVIGYTLKQPAWGIPRAYSFEWPAQMAGALDLRGLLRITRADYAGP